MTRAAYLDLKGDAGFCKAHPATLPVNVEDDGKNQVLAFTPRDGSPMFIACLWSHWTGPTGKEPDLLSFAAITDDPEPEVAAAGHDRTIARSSTSSPNTSGLGSPQKAVRSRRCIPFSTTSSTPTTSARWPRQRDLRCAPLSRSAWQDPAV